MGSEEKNGGVNNDISADELLVLLNKSIERTNSSDGTPHGGEKKSDGETAAQMKAADGQLSIDDLVYRVAEKKLHRSDALTQTDDSDLDVDELLEKFVNQPKRERELAAEQAEAERIAAEQAAEQVAEMTVADEELSFSDEVTPENIDVAGEADAETEEIVVEDLMPEPVAAEMAEITAESMAEKATEEMDTRETAVFDISLVKKIAEAEAEEIDAPMADEAFTQSETEVFDTVSEEVQAIEVAEPADEPAVAEQVYGKADTGEIDQTDLNLMLAFGMNEELTDTVGEEKAVEIEDDIIKRHEETAQMQAVPEKMEFTDREQVDEILNSYKSKYYAVIFRIAAALALLVGVFFMENATLLGLSFPKFMSPTSYPMVYAMLDLQLIVFCGALVWKQLYSGAKSIISLKPTPESLTAFVFALSLIYTFIAGIIAPADGFGLYNLPVALATVLALVYEFFNVKREVFSFNVVASVKKKFVVTPVSGETESLEREVFKDYLPADSRIVRVGKTDFVDGFFARSEACPAFKPIIGILIPVVLILSAIFMIVAFYKTGSVYRAFTAAFITMTVTTPMAAFMVYSYPFYKASKDAFKRESAIIGESSLAEYAESSVISFEDKEVFPSRGVKVTSIKVYGNNRIDEIIYCLASAFVKVGGPLADVFSKATHDLGISEDVELVDVDDDGFTVSVDYVQVYIGKGSYMEKRDYDIPFDAESRKLEESGTVGVMYVAYGGQLAAKVYVKYTIDSEFESILSQLYRTGMCVGIKSFDPNIDDLLLANKLKEIKYPVKVIRSKTVEDIPQTVDRCESGIVSKRSVKALLKTVAACERTGRVIKTSLIVKILAMLIGVVVMIFIQAFGDKAAISSLYLTLYQIFWTVPVFLISKFLV